MIQESPDLSQKRDSGSLTVGEVAEKTGLSGRTIRNYIADQKLKAHKEGGKYLIDKESFRDFMAKEKPIAGKVYSYLDRKGWSYETEVKREGTMIALHVHGDFTNYQIFIVVREEYGLVTFIIPKLIRLDKEMYSSDKRLKLASKLLNLNRRIHLANFGMDKRNSISIELEIPIEDGDLTYKQFMICLQVMMSTVDKFYPELIKILQE